MQYIVCQYYKDFAHIFNTAMPTFLAKEAWQFPMMINREDSFIRCKKNQASLILFRSLMRIFASDD